MRYLDWQFHFMKNIILSAIAIFMAGGFFVVAPVTKAATWYVSPGGSGTGDGLSPGNATSTIQSAINAAAGGDTVDVAAGTYDLASPIVVNKELTLSGDTATPSNIVINAATIAGTDKDGFQVLADNVTIQGFKIQGATETDSTVELNAAIVIGGRYRLTFGPAPGSHAPIVGVQYARILNNELTASAFGVINYRAMHTLIQDNVIHDLIRASGDWAGKGIWIGNETINNPVGTDTIQSYDVQILDNQIYDNALIGIEIENASAASTLGHLLDLQVLIRGNTIHDNGGAASDLAAVSHIYRGINSNGGDTGVTVRDNDVYGHKPPNTATNAANSTGIRASDSGGWLIELNRIFDNARGIYLAGTAVAPANVNTGHQIQDNEIYNNAQAIVVRNGPMGTASNDSLHGNTTTTWSGIGVAPYGILNTGTGSFTATNNWWGAASGPAPTGTGDLVSANVTYNPWFTNSAMTTVSSEKAVVSFNFTTPSVLGVVSSTAYAVSLLVPNVTDVTALVPTIALSNGATVNPNTGVAQDFTSPVTYTVTAADGTTRSYLVTVTKTAATQTVPDGSGNASVNNTTPQVVVTSPNQTLTVTVNSGTDNPSIDYSALVSGGSGTLPQTTIDSALADITIPSSTVVTSADPAWDGVMQAPTVTTITLPVTSGQTKTVSMAIEIGFTGAKLSFDKSVKMLFSGQAGKKVGSSTAGGAFTEITVTCGANSQAWADANLGADGACKIDAGSDLVVWTKHFTKFAVYTQTQNPSSGGGGGGGGILVTPPILGPTPVAISGTSDVTTRNITLVFSVSGAISMAISENANFSGVTWDTYALTKNFTLSDGYGQKTIYIKFRSSSGGDAITQIVLNYLPPGTVLAAPTATTIPSATPKAVISTTGLTINFRAGLTDKQKQGIIDLVNSGKLFLEADAKNYAYATGQSNWQQFVGKNPAVMVAADRYVFTLFLKEGAVGDEVRALQRKLRDLGYFNYPSISGYFGPVTKAAVIEYQKAKGIAPYPGYVGPGTRAALNAE